MRTNIFSGDVTVSRRMAVHMSVRRPKNRLWHRWGVFASLLFTPVAACIDWLQCPEIKTNVKVREVLFAPFKLAAFLLGYGDECAILDTGMRDDEGNISYPSVAREK